MDIVDYINKRREAKKSSDPEVVAWYISLAGNPAANEQFGIARRHVEALTGGGWANHGSYGDLATFLSMRDELSERVDDNPTRFTSVPFIVEGNRRYFLLEAPRSR